MSRTLAIGDIHGCSAALDLLLGIVEPVRDDIVITLGDYVDRGPDSMGVLERLITLEKAVHLVPLLGNHDEMMLESRGGGLDWQLGYGEATIESYGGELGKIPEAHWRFLERCHGWYETSTHIFAHASIEPHVAMDQQTTYVLRWNSLRVDAVAHRSGRTFVCGHASQKDGRPLDLGHSVCIDTYAYGGGWLTCLEPATGRVWMANQRGDTRSAWLSDVAKSQ